MSKRKAEEDGAGEPDAKKPSVEGGPASQLAIKTALSGSQTVRVYEAAIGGEFVKDIEINDLRNRYMLTKGPAQAKIISDTGAAIETRGVWYPDKSLATERDPPLYLHITAKSRTSLDAAVAAIRQLMDQELGPLTAREQREERNAKRKWPEVKCYVNLEPLRNFNLRAKIIGPGGLFVKHIQQETGARVQIRGLGSGFIDSETGQEHQDGLHICLLGPEESQLERAKDLADDLLVVVREEWGKAKAVLDQAAFPGGGYTSYAAYPGMVAPDGTANTAATNEQYAAYWQQIQSNPEYMAYYQQMMAAYGQQAPQPGMMPPPPAAAPPPAPAGRAPAPPQMPAPPLPPSERREGGGRYGAVPPPPS